MVTAYSSNQVSGSDAVHSTALHPEAIALKLRQLSSEPDNQQYIAREPGCISGLINFLEPSTDLRVRLMASQAVLFLSSHPSNRKLLFGMKPLVDRLTALCTDLNPNLAHFASAALVNLTKSDDMRTQSFKKKSLEVVKLQLGAVTMDEVAVKSALLSVAGVVSVTLNRRCIASIYSIKKSLAFALIEALRRLNVDAAEILEKHSNVDAAASATPPQYLEHQSFKARPDALSIYSDSFEESTLANRLARQRQMERQRVDSQNKAQSIFTKVWTSIW
jgi:hypothetical protein